MEKKLNLVIPHGTRSGCGSMEVPEPRIEDLAVLGLKISPLSDGLS